MRDPINYEEIRRPIQREEHGKPHEGTESVRSVISDTDLFLDTAIAALRARWLNH